MAKMIKRGETLLIPFRNGVSLSDSQQNPRMYKTRKAFDRMFPVLDHGTDGVELVEYAEVRHGEWIAASVDPIDPYFRCSVCRYGTDTIYDGCDEYRYCPNCGAKMKGAENDG